MSNNDKMVAYICDGKDECSLKPGCFMRNDPLCKSDMVCKHTLNPKHAATSLCEDPENHPERFAAYPEFDTIKYYELEPGDEV